MPHLLTGFAVPSRQVEQLQKKKREIGFGVVKKEDSVAQKEPRFKMQNTPASPVSSNKAARDCVMTRLPYLKTQNFCRIGYRKNKIYSMTD